MDLLLDQGFTGSARVRTPTAADPHPKPQRPFRVRPRPWAESGGRGRFPTPKGLDPIRLRVPRTENLQRTNGLGEIRVPPEDRVSGREGEHAV